MTTDQSAAARVKDVASTATDEGKHVGSVAKEEAQNVAGTAAEQARNVASDAISQLRDQVTEQTSGQRDRLVETLRSLGDDLERMADQTSEGGIATDLVREAADRARSLRDRLDGRDPGQLLDDVRGFARRRPGTFLIGALAVGVVAGRLFRGAADGAAAAELAGPATTPATTATSTPVAAPVAGSASTQPDPDGVLEAGGSTAPLTAGDPPLPPSTLGRPTIEAP
jgi:hypothetical protein